MNKSRTRSPTEPARTMVAAPRADTSVWEQHLESLNASPLDPEGWNRLISLTGCSGDTARIEKQYDKLLAVYPDAAAAQISYIAHTIAHGSHQSVEALFKRFLIKSPSVGLWKLYMTYIREKNRGSQYQETVYKAFEFTLMHVGHDQDAGGIWLDYLCFVRESEADMQASTQQEDMPKRRRLRAIYQRAVCVPLANIDQLWREYEQFEHDLNPATAKNILDQHETAYTKARTVLHQLETHLKAIESRSISSELPIQLPTQPVFSLADRTLVGAWKAYLRWEESNPLGIDDSTRFAYIVRTRSAYRKALTSMRFFPEIWHMAYLWLDGVGMATQAAQLLKDGISANPTSFVLNFACTEALEAKGSEHFGTVHTMYKAFLTALREDLDVRMDKLAQQSENEDIAAKDLSDRQREYGVVWVMYMRFARRAEGTQAARNVFKEACQDQHTPWQTYEAAARSEYHSTRDAGIATRIYQKGLHIFRDKADYVVHYLDFLLSINDEKNAGVLFSDVIRTLPSKEARPVWERWVRHNYLYSDLATALALDKKMSEVYPEERTMKRLAQRHRLNGLDTIAARDLGFTGASQHMHNQITAAASSRALNRSNGLEEGVGRANTRPHELAGHKRNRNSSPFEDKPAVQRRRLDPPNGSD